MFLPEADRDYLDAKGFHYEQKTIAQINGLIIRNWKLPEGKYNKLFTDLLILIPKGYPDVHPDMWYFYPHILLLPNNRPAKATESQYNFDGIIWQRWSRHMAAGDWRSGVDGIHSFLQKVKIALEIAQ
jgi:hypothetical protein